MELTQNLELGPYRLKRLVGRGGMSSVYEAEDTRIGRRVAIKVMRVPGYLPASEQSAIIARMQREARAIARLSHPGVVAIYTIGEHEDAYYLVMEFLDGVTLAERLQQGPLAWDEVATILEQVAEALDAVHAANIVHRDLKPSNVMLLPANPASGRGFSDREQKSTLRVKLLDFGVARPSDDATVTQAGMLVGTPAYLAPEMAKGSKATAASDIWALGVLLYEMLTARQPFTGEMLPTVMYKVVHDAPDPTPELPPALQTMLQTALEKDPARRFPTGRALTEAYRAALVEAVTTPPSRVVQPTLLTAPGREVPAEAVEAREPEPQKRDVLQRRNSEAATVVAPAPRTPAPDSRHPAQKRLHIGLLPATVFGLVLLALAVAGFRSLNPGHRTEPVEEFRAVREKADDKDIPTPKPEIQTSQASEEVQNPVSDLPTPEPTPPEPTPIPAQTPLPRRRPSVVIVPTPEAVVPSATPDAIVVEVPPPSRPRATPVPATPEPTAKPQAVVKQKTVPQANGRPVPDKKPVIVATPRPRPTGKAKEDSGEVYAKLSPPVTPAPVEERATPVTPRAEPTPVVTATPAPPPVLTATPAPPPVLTATPAPPPVLTEKTTEESEAKITRKAASLDELHEELRALLDAWIEAGINRDIPGHMVFYPKRLDRYYTLKNVSYRDVEKDKARIFGNATRVFLKIGEPVIDIAEDGRSAVMRYRKDYEIIGGPGARQGAVWEELRWRLTRGTNDWKIFSERDLRVLR